MWLDIPCCLSQTGEALPPALATPKQKTMTWLQMQTVKEATHNLGPYVHCVRTHPLDSGITVAHYLPIFCFHFVDTQHDQMQ